MAKKEKNLKNNFNFDDNNADYNFQLKKKRNLWWLLLLLLPLLLLIPLKKDITVETRVDGAPEPYVNVGMNYTAHYLLWNGKLLPKISYDTIQQTDSTGRTVFKDLGYSVYQLVFRFRNPIVFSVADSECFDSTAVAYRFHTTRHAVLDLEPRLVDVRLKVVDQELGFELPDATVECEYEGRNGIQHSTGTTDAAGCVVVRDVRLCSSFNSIQVSADGYADTLLMQLEVEELLANREGYVIPLRPLKDRIIFYVKHLYTKEPIPGATAEVTLTLNGVVGSVGHTTTNVDGLGQGFYEEARLLAKVGIHASKVGFHDSVFVAPRDKPNPMTVRDFIKLDSADRIIWLRPELHTVQFRNVDTVTMEPIEGVTNEITIESIDGTTKTRVELSNSNGYFPVTALPGDKITIISTKDPYYYSKTTVIDEFIEEEIIYMRPKTVTLDFRTVVQADWSLLPDCSLVITVDGRRVNPTNSGNGNFSVPNLLLSSTISIVASKEYYNTNRTKVHNRNVGDLYQAPQDERDIPLGIERVCGTLYQSKSDASNSNNTQMKYPHVMDKPSGRFKFMFDTYSFPDAFEVWNCRPDEVGHVSASRRLYKWAENVSASPTTVWLDYHDGPFITVVAFRSQKDGTNSDFEYLICCPDEDCPWPSH